MRNAGNPVAGGRKARRPGREWLIRIVMVSVSLLLPLAAGELLLRALAPPPDSGNLFVAAPDSEVEWRGVPFARGRIAGVRVALNSLGLRERALALERTPGTFRIIVLGDSMAFGPGAPQESVWPRVLESALGAARRRGVDDTQVVNMAIPGYNTLQELAQLREIGLGLRPDLVVVAFFYNDVELTSRQQAKLHPAVPAGEGKGAVDVRSSIDRAITGLKSESLLFAYLSPRIGAVMRRFGSKRFGQAASYNRMYGPDQPGWLRVRHALLEMKALTAQAGSELVVVVLPAMVSCAPETYPLQTYHDAVDSFLRENAIGYLDLLPDMRGVDFSRMWVTPTDGHPNAEAHRLIGEAIARQLAAHLATIVPSRRTR